MRYVFYHPKRGKACVWTYGGVVTWTTPAFWWAANLSYEYVQLWALNRGFKVKRVGLETMPRERYTEGLKRLATALLEAEVITHVRTP